MLTIEVPDQEYFDETKNEFVILKGQKLTLEHSLISISKWEMKWHKAFLGDGEKTVEETLDYVRCMNIGPINDPDIFYRLEPEQIEKINAYISEPMTATTFSSRRPGAPNRPHSRDVITNELIYYWMIGYNIPFDPCEKWHFERLMTLIKVCEVKSEKPQKMSKRELAARNAALNAQRRAKLKTKG